jgi:O-acetyl-ADP-ribose deacetylase (regulator of RNase III)
MIVYRTGDVVEAFKKGEIDVLVHGCNGCGVMGSGIAKQIKDEFPWAYDAYKKYEKDYGLGLGTFSYQFHPMTDGKLRGVINLVTQDKYLPRDQRHFSYDYFCNGISNVASSFPLKKIGMPKIGAGLGGGDWKVIEAIINSRFPDREIYVYTLEEPARKNGRNDFA